MSAARAPGRVNLIGDHTDYTGGWVLPMAIDLETVVDFRPGGGDGVRLTSDHTDDPHWARYVDGVVAVVRPDAAGTGTVRTTIPVGAGLSSSAALEVAVALAIGFAGSPLELARACQRAEHRATGVPSGLMDQLASAAGVAGHALLIDCRSDEVTPVPIAEGVDVVAVHSGQPRTLAGSAYAQRRAQCDAAEAIVGPLRDASLADLVVLDPILQRRARHVVSENARVLEFAARLRAGDLAGAGALMRESHCSLRDDFEVSTPALDALVDRLLATPGVYGARLTGAGFGGCAVALTVSGVLREGWRLRAADGAGLLRVDAE
ncbi:MAG: galactokinase [Acidimicrobiales bacterium]